MKFLRKTKDGGPQSTVDAFFLVEIKSLFSIAILKFNKGSRNNYHSHAFDALTWFVCGDMEENRIVGDEVVVNKYKRSLFPKITTKDNLHKVYANKTSWCVTIRGRWVDSWKEVTPNMDKIYTLTHGRKITKIEVYR